MTTTTARARTTRAPAAAINRPPVDCVYKVTASVYKKLCSVRIYRNGKYFSTLKRAVALKRAQRICRHFNRTNKNGPCMAAFVPCPVEAGGWLLP